MSLLGGVVGDELDYVFDGTEFGFGCFIKDDELLGRV